MLKRLIGDWLNEALPIKTKRQVFLVSFAALLKGATSFDRETFHKLNRVLSLSESNDNALAVPVMLSKVIWNGKTMRDICHEDVSVGSFTSDRITTIVSNILNHMPRFLHYGDTKRIETDIGVILTNRMQLLGV